MFPLDLILFLPSCVLPSSRLSSSSLLFPSSPFLLLSLLCDCLTLELVPADRLGAMVEVTGFPRESCVVAGTVVMVVEVVAVSLDRE